MPSSILDLIVLSNPSNNHIQIGFKTLFEVHEMNTFIIKYQKQENRKILHGFFEADWVGERENIVPHPNLASF